MKRIPFISCGAVLLFLIAAIFAADKKQTDPADAQAKVAELTKQVDTLHAKLKGLEERLAKLEKERPIVTVTSIIDGSIITVPSAIPNRDLLEQGFADPNHPPKIWGEGECNGWKYYMIPLVANEHGTAVPIPLSADPLTAAR
jgi:hypothetical protein